MTRLAHFAAIAAILLGACSAADDPVADVFGEDGAGERLVLVVDVEGGPTQGDYLLAFPPTYSIYADGSMYFMRHEPSDPPFNPLFKSIARAKLTDTQVTDIATLVTEIGLANLDAEVDLSQTQTAVDATTTRATLIDPDGAIHSFGVYDLRPGQEEVGTRNETLATLMGVLNNIAAIAVPDEHRPERLEVTWRERRDGDRVRAYPWPIPVMDPEDFGEMATSGTRCIVLEDIEALAVAELLSSVPWESLFIHGETVYRVIARNLLPSEVGCG